MKCKACSGQLVMREAHDYPIDETGVWTIAAGAAAYRWVVCLDCGARHSYDTIHTSGDQNTVALEVNTDPEPVVKVAIGFRGGIVDAIGADRLTGLIIIDEDRQEIGRFLAVPNQEAKWWERMKQLEALIPKGESSASFKTEGGC